MMKKVLASILTLCLLLSGCANRNEQPGGTTATSEDATKAFADYQTNELVKILESSKLTAHYTIADLSVYGLADSEPILDNSDDGLESYQESLDELHKIKRSSLSESDQNLYDRYEAYLKTQLSYEGLLDYIFYFSPGNGLNVNMLTNFTEYVIREEKDITDVIQYLIQSKDYIDKYITKTKEQADKGIEQASNTMVGIIDSCQKFVDTKGNTEVANSLNKQIDAATYLDDAKKADYKKQINEATDNYLVTAFQDVIDYYNDRKDKTTSDGSYASSSQGKKFYAALLADKSSSSLTPKKAEQELNTFIADQITELQTIYMKDSAAYTLDPNFGYTVPEDILMHIRTSMSEDFPAAADVQYTINYLDPSVTFDTIAAYYVNPTIDDVKDNVIKVNGNASNDLYTTLAHEGYPGHCYQITYELTNHYSPLLGVLSFIGYTEGWAVYVEELSLDYSAITNPNTIRMYSIETLLFYCVVSVADIMVHYDGATLEDVEDFVSQLYGEGAGQQVYDIVIDDPGLYLPYGLGYMQMYQLSKDTQEKLGDKFDLKEFNQVVLDAGTCDFDYLNSQVAAYISSKK